MDDDQKQNNDDVVVSNEQKENNNNNESKENEYLEYKPKLDKNKKTENEKKTKPLTHKQRMKLHKKNLKKLPAFLRNRNVKKDLINQMTGYNNMFNGNKFTANQLTRYSKSIRKLRKKKKSKKLKKIAMTNQIQYMNILFNADRELNSMSKFNLMKTTPQGYVDTMFNNANFNQLWKSTSLPCAKNKKSMIKNINASFHSLLLNGLIKELKKN